MTPHPENTPVKYYDIKGGKIFFYAKDCKQVGTPMKPPVIPENIYKLYHRLGIMPLPKMN